MKDIENRMGKILMSNYRPFKDIYEVFLALAFIPYRIDIQDAMSGTKIFTGLCKHFRPIEEGGKIPTYQILVTTSFDETGGILKYAFEEIKDEQANK